MLLFMGRVVHAIDHAAVRGLMGRRLHLIHVCRDIRGMTVICTRRDIGGVSGEM